MTLNTKSKREYLQKYSIFIVLIALFVVCSFISPFFLSSANLINISKQLSVGILIAYGEMLLIINGHLDLSVGAVLALAGVVSCNTYKATGSIIVALLVAILIAVGCNLINALFVAKFNVPAFIATLGMMQAARGAALYYTGGANILQLGNYVKIGQGTIGPIPICVIIVAVITVIIWYIVNHTRYGRAIYAIGGSRSAAEASGINAKKTIVMSFVINGILVGFAAVIFMARNNAGLPNGAIGYEMTGLTAAIVGGTSFSGGIGTVAGTIAGAFIIGFLENVMNLLGVNSFIQQIIEGAIVVLAVTFDVVSKSRKSAKVVMAQPDAANTDEKPDQTDAGGVADPQ